MHVIADYENITDHLYHMVVTINRLWESGNEFSADAMAQLHEINEITDRVLKLSEECFYNPDSKKAFKIISLEQRIVKLCEKARDDHMKRLISGACSVTEGSVFTDLLLCYERISDHLSKQARQSLFDSYKSREPEQEDFFRCWLIRIRMRKISLEEIRLNKRKFDLRLFRLKNRS